MGSDPSENTIRFDPTFLLFTCYRVYAYFSRVYLSFATVMQFFYSQKRLRQTYQTFVCLTCYWIRLFYLVYSQFVIQETEIERYAPVFSDSFDIALIFWIGLFCAFDRQNWETHEIHFFEWVIWFTLFCFDSVIPCFWSTQFKQIHESVLDRTLKIIWIMFGSLFHVCDWSGLDKSRNLSCSTFYIICMVFVGLFRLCDQQNSETHMNSFVFAVFISFTSF
jgi:hypothetical protein